MKKILIVEDDWGILNAVDTLLSESYEVVAASDAHSAFEALSSNRIDLILLDLVMPGISGADLLDQIVSMGMKIPTIVMTANPENPNVPNGECVKAVLAKPFDISALESLIAVSLSDTGVVDPLIRRPHEQKNSA